MQRYNFLLIINVLSLFSLMQAWSDNSVPSGSGIESCVTLTEIKLEGGEGLPRDGLIELAQPLLGRALTLSDLEELRYRITQHLIDQGYINSGAILVPEQDFSNGIVRYQLISGKLEAMHITGNERLQTAYFERRLKIKDDPVFNSEELKNRFQLLLEDPLIEHLNGTLMPGSAPGSGILQLEVERTRPWDFFLRTDNARPPSTGAERAYAGGTLRNITGWGDSFSLITGLGYQGQGREGSFDYKLLLFATETQLMLHAEYTDSALIEQPLADLDISSATRRAEAGFTHTLRHTIADTWNVDLRMTWGKNRTKLLDEPFTFSEGSVEGESHVSALRSASEYNNRQVNRAFALRSQLSWGFDMWDATINPQGVPDGRFFSWIGQGEYIRKLTSSGLQLHARTAMQWAGAGLLALEQFSVGGHSTVRGYRENQQVGDNGYDASIELRQPIWNGKIADQAHQLQIFIFTDVGKAWNRSHASDQNTLYSGGIGLAWTLGKLIQAEVSWAHPFAAPPDPEEHNLQDEGVNFLVQFNF